jgi:hypothetical protein
VFATEQDGAARPPHWGYHGEYRWPRKNIRDSGLRATKGRVHLLDVYAMQDVASERLIWTTLTATRNGVKFGYSVVFTDERQLEDRGGCPFDP